MKRRKGEKSWNPNNVQSIQNINDHGYNLVASLMKALIDSGIHFVTRVLKKIASQNGKQ
jgi:hypothetical protein